MYWKGFEPSELLDYESRLVAFTQELPFQEGRPLSPIAEGESSTELLEYSLRANHSPDRQVCMASLHNAKEDELDTQYDNEQLADVSADEPTANSPQDEDEEHRRIRQAKNAKRAQRRRNAQNRAREPRDLNNAFALVVDCEYRTPMGNIQCLPLGISSRGLSNMVILHWSVAPLEEATRVGGTTTACAMRAICLRVATMNKKYNNLPATSGGQGRTAKIHLRPTSMMLPWSTSGKKINEGCDVRLVIEARRRKHPVRYHDDDDNDRFPRLQHRHHQQVLAQGLQTSRNPQV
jgi:hypothetical protein